MKKVKDFKVIDTKWLNSSSYILKLGSECEIENTEPGNFAEIKVPDTPDVFLRRPISVYDVDYENRTISFYIKAIGKGTNKLGTIDNGSIVNIVYPLGNSFNLIKNGKALLIGGGSGIAPFSLLAKKLQKNNTSVTYLFGARSKEDIVLVNEFSKFGEVLVTTEDGTLGEKGIVTQHSVFDKISDFDIIYTCGPDPMMKAIASIAESKDIVCEASLENMMACGIGACLCCVTPTIRGNECVCTEGPVFNSKELKW